MNKFNKRPHKKEVFPIVLPNHRLHYFAPMELNFQTNQYK